LLLISSINTTHFYLSVQPHFRYGGVIFISGGEDDLKQLVNLSNGRIIAKQVKEANSFWQRFRGLMFTRTFPSGGALYIKPCRSIHTFFMNYAIDVMYLDANFQIVGLDIAVPPGKVGKSYKDAKSVVELPANKVLETETKIGHYIKRI
jgi:uncharacterized protein